MARPITLVTGQWADLPLEKLSAMARGFGFDGLELATWGDHFDVHAAVKQKDYCSKHRATLEKHGLKVFAISAHLAGQAVCDLIDERHKVIVPRHVWGDGDPEGVRKRAAQEVIAIGKGAKAYGLSVVTGFTGSSIWHLNYAFPPTPQKMIDAGYKDFAKRWKPILDAYQKMGVKFALEVHPTEIAFDLASAERALEAVDYHPAFGFNYDPSHFGYQGVDYVEFIYRFADRIFHAHMKDVQWSQVPNSSGVFGGHLPFGDRRRYWDFCSIGRGNINFEKIIRALNHIGYNGPLSVEWEDSGMDREQGARESCEYVRKLDFSPSTLEFDKQFGKQ
jgi:sugar phosphate isomerase/epimerase